MYNLQTRIQFITEIGIWEKQLNNKCIHRPKRVNLICVFRNCSRNYRLCPVWTRLLGFHLTAPSVLVRSQQSSLNKRYRLIEGLTWRWIVNSAFETLLIRIYANTYNQVVASSILKLTISF